ncbi:OmpA family protein [Oecophyllibacter saccharovorans]|uniref:OmpA-like domain-containing protein n=1 Tax=Oecophyllibacter saccharovorans TaxID=2558360 RepID=A0A506UR86_9PROT|nr:OmpA family protein [Oecophyllibacter saccharovorans]TPW34916.1 hypothetical protein E3203_05270 [Oecophyllibacter saccharovorans]TPW35854.1 hypothetical protein E3202_02710 [Oecophyllibacter saccharovorans]
MKASSRAAPLPPAPQRPGFTTVPAIPAGPPKPVVIAPPFVPVPTHPPVPPEPVVANPQAGSRIVPLPQANGTSADLRVLFAPNSAALNAQTIEALRKAGHDLAAMPERRIFLRAYAELPGQDVSMPRRLALQRALAVRSLLVSSGVATTRIYPVAYGRPSPQDHDPGDRLDLITQANPPPAVTPVPGEPVHDGQPYDPLLSPVNYSASPLHANAPSARSGHNAGKRSAVTGDVSRKNTRTSSGSSSSSGNAPPSQGASGP